MDAQSSPTDDDGNGSSATRTADEDVPSPTVEELDGFIAEYQSIKELVSEDATVTPYVRPDTFRITIEYPTEHGE